MTTSHAQNDAQECGRFARSLAAETFQYRDLRPMRDHDEILSRWADQPGFLEGYLEDA